MKGGGVLLPVSPTLGLPAAGKACDRFPANACALSAKCAYPAWLSHDASGLGQCAVCLVTMV